MIGNIIDLKEERGVVGTDNVYDGAADPKKRDEALMFQKAVQAAILEGMMEGILEADLESGMVGFEEEGHVLEIEDETELLQMNEEDLEQDLELDEIDLLGGF